MSTVSSLNSISLQPVIVSKRNPESSNPAEGNSSKASQAKAPPRSQHPKIISLQDLFRPKILLNKILLKLLYPGDPAAALPFLANLKEFEKLGAIIEPKYILTEKGRRILTYHMKHAAGEHNTQVYFHGNAGNVNTFSNEALEDFKIVYQKNILDDNFIRFINVMTGKTLEEVITHQIINKDKSFLINGN
jgi:hypothetical protein